MSTSVERFTAAWNSDAPRVLSYARRHVGFADAPDVVSETFAAAWRRWADLPEPPTPWLIGAARRIILNHRRSARRRMALEQRIRLLDAVAAQPDDAWLRGDALQRLASLSEEHREALLLVSWDGLTSEEASTALGISSSAFRKRLQRARAFLDATDTMSLSLAKEIS